MAVPPVSKKKASRKRRAKAKSGRFRAMDLISVMRAEEARQEAEALEAIKAVHKAGSTFSVPEEWRPVGNISRGPGAKQRLSPSGEHLGWYREGQTTGRPNKNLPLAVDIERAKDDYYRTLRKVIPKPQTARVLAGFSATVRQGISVAAAILEEANRLAAEGVVPKQGRTKEIAQRLKCSAEYVRRVLRQAKKSSAGPKSK